eukprot:18685-Heterococcus_DN1.PRE.1
MTPTRLEQCSTEIRTQKDTNATDTSDTCTTYIAILRETPLRAPDVTTPLCAPCHIHSGSTPAAAATFAIGTVSSLAARSHMHIGRLLD